GVVRDVCSSPTRRSSDLGPCDAVCPAPIVHGSHEGASRRRLPACVGAAHRTLLTVEPRTRLSAQVTRYPSPPPSRRPPALPPGRSEEHTLNSSHVSISYA